MLFNRKFYFLPKLDFSKNLFNSMALTKFSHHIELSAGRHFRAPNLNDLYWEPGGNPELAAETGYKADVRYSVRMSRNNNFARGFLLRINPYFRNINNRILWLPSDAFWSPQQAGKVESMGIDISSSYENSFRKKHEFNWKAYANYSYSHSIVKESIIPNDASVGKQLIYTPMHRWTAGVSLTNNKWGLDYRHQLTGKYYLTTDNSQEQASYQTGDLSISYSIQKKTNFTIMLNAYNIWNEQYQVLPWRPMPGRNFRISLQLSKNNSKKKN